MMRAQVRIQAEWRRCCWMIRAAAWLRGDSTPLRFYPRGARVLCQGTRSRSQVLIGYRISWTPTTHVLVTSALVNRRLHEAENAHMFVLCIAVLFVVVERATGARSADVADDARPDCPGCATSDRTAIFLEGDSVTGAYRGRCGALPVNRRVWICVDRRKRAAIDAHGRFATGCPAEGIVYNRR